MSNGVEGMSKDAENFWQQTGWFFDLLAKLTSDPHSVSPILDTKVAGLDSAKSPIESALTLFLVALYGQKSGDMELIHSVEISNACDRIVSALASATDPFFSGSSQVWVLALWVGALRNINLFLKRDDIRRVTSSIKSHVYKHGVKDAMLMSSTDRKELGYDVLFSSVPMGLFEPEDLVLVEALRVLGARERLKEALAEEKLLLAWYYCEQGSYAKARELVLAQTSSSPLKAIVEHGLLSLGQLEGRFIVHKPMGNGNRYEPLIEERFPKLVTDRDDVIIRAQSAPFSASEPLELVVGDKTIAGSKRKDCWQFIIPAMAAGTKVSYHLRFATSAQKSVGPFCYEVLHKRKLRRVSGVLAKENEIIIAGDNCAINLKPGNDGQLDFKVRPGFARALPGMTKAQNINLGAFDIGIVKEPFSLHVSHNGRKLFDGSQVEWLEDNDGDVSQIEMALGVDPCAIYGLGERYNALDQWGNRPDQFVYNQYKDQGLRTYMPMSVFYGSGGFGVHINTYCYSWFDFGASDKSKIVLGAEENSLALQILAGDINEQAAQFIARTGEPKMVPDWALGPWMSSNNWDSEAEVRRQVALTKEHEIPATVLVIEAWSDEATFYIFNDAIYDENDGETALEYSDFSFPEWGRWPDPKGLVAHLHENDLKCLLWQIPIIKQVTSLVHLQKSNDEAVFIRHGFAVKNADGSPYRLPEGWFKDALLMDFSNRQAKDWWFEKRQYLIDDIGVDGFKTDGGECVFGHDLVFADGSNGAIMRNKYPNDYISAYYDFAQQNNGITFSRAGYSGAQSFPAHWAGDERSSWGAFKRSMLAGLSAGMSGIIFWGWDLAGFSGPVPSAELYIRSAQMACFCPIMQYHAESRAEHDQDRTPWNIAKRSGDERALSIYRFYANLRMSLMPYLVREAKKSVADKTPLMRAMVLDHQDDRQASALWDQYMFGRNLLVAPVITKGKTTRKAYLPAGKWWHLFQNEWFEAGEHEVAVSLAEIAVFVRSGAIVALAFAEEIRLGAAMPCDVEKANNIVLLVANCGDGSAHHQQQDGAMISVEWNIKDGAKITIRGLLQKQYFVVFATAPARVTVNGNERSMNYISLAGAPLCAVSL